MNLAVTVKQAVFLKDVRVLWPMAALTVTLILAKTLYDGDLSPAADYLPIAAILAAGLFVLALLQEDAPSSLRHDWLSRPIGRLDLLSAKAILAAAVVLAPAAIGPALAAARDGAPVDEALLAALGGTRGYIALGFGLLVVAAVTSTLLEAIGLLIGLFLLYVFVPPFVLPISGLQEGVMFLGSGWVVLSALGAVALAGGIAVLWLAYARRRTGAARVALAVTLAGFTAVLAVLGWDQVFAAQRAATPGDPAERTFTLTPGPGCLQARWLGAPPPPDQTEGPWSAEQQQRAGFGAMALWTAARPQGLPDGWRIAITHVAAEARGGPGSKPIPLALGRITTTWARGVDGRAEARHAWLLSRDRARALLADRRALKVDYKVALLAPVHAAELAADGRRRQLPGLGSCVATPRPGSTIEVSCFKAGRQPDVLTARPPGAGADLEAAGGWQSFAPDVLQLTAGQRRTMIVRAAPADTAPRVVITAYEARAHVARSLSLPGLLGGASCRPADPT